MDLSTTPTCRIFLSVARSSVHCMNDWIVHFWSSSMDNIHGRLHYSPSIDNVHGRPYYHPRKTSSIIYHILVQETFLVSLVMILDLVRSLGHGRSFWTNWRWTNFSVSYQLPLRSKGRPGYRRNLKLIYTGLCKPYVIKSLVDLLCASHLPKEMPRFNFWMACVVS